MNSNSKLKRVFDIIDLANEGQVNVQDIKWVRYNSVSFRNMEVWLAKSDGKALVIMLIPLPPPIGADEQMYHVILEDIGNPTENTTYEILSKSEIVKFYNLEVKSDSKARIANSLIGNIVGNHSVIKQLSTIDEANGNQEIIAGTSLAISKIVIQALDDKGLNNFV